MTPDNVKYQRRSVRLTDYDYSQAGAYFITICTQSRELRLSDITNFQTALLPIGKMAQEYWLQIPEHFNNVQLNEYIIMPNHIHGILVINTSDKCRGVPVNDRNVGALQCNAPTNNRQSNAPTNYYSKISPKKNTLSVIIRTYKTALTHWCRKNDFRHFAWQRSYYEHVIRSMAELNRIQEYILNNPLKWELDRENPDSLNYKLEHDQYFNEIYE
jgi:putative transposase